MQILELAKKYGKTPAQIVLNHTLCSGISVVPKTNNLQRLEENFNVLFHIEDTDFRDIAELVGVHGEKGIRNLEMTDYLGFDNFNEEFEEP